MKSPKVSPSPSNFRFAHLADAHIGAWPKDTSLRRLLRESVVRALRTVLEERCEFLLIAGDLFHVSTPDPAEVAPIAALLREINESGTRIYAIFGSHDYVPSQTSWLDVLSEGGLFTKVAPPVAFSEGEGWTLPFVRDAGTGSVIAGVPGRALGLDRTHYLTMDHGEFTAQEGFRIFLFHAGILEFLPQGLREHIQGVALDQLPPDCDYYAGGHIHSTYSGKGPGSRGLLVNPGATFGTSVTDLENISKGVTQAGLVVVDVVDGIPNARWVITTPKESVNVVDIEVEGCGVAEAVDRIQRKVGEGEAESDSILIPKLHGAKDVRLELGSFSAELRKMNVSAVHLDLKDLTSAESTQADLPPPQAGDIENAVLKQTIGGSKIMPQLSGETGVLTALDLLKVLGTPADDGETKEDYKKRIVNPAVKLLSKHLDLEAGEA